MPPGREGARSAAPLRVAFLPPPRPAEPASFLALLAAAVQGAGATPVSPRARGLRWSLRVSGIDVVHLHWLEYVASSDPAPWLGWARTWLRILRLVAVLLVLRARSVAVVWTIHNLTPHEPVRPRAERCLAQAVLLLADEVIVHSEHARARVRARFRTRPGQPITVIPHANYVGAFPPPQRTRRELRAALGIPEDAFVYLAFGVIRSYKRLAMLAERFSALEGDRLRLLIAGTPSPPAEADALRALAAADPRILLHARHVPDAEVRELHAAADAAVLAYAEVFSSGALLLALTEGLPVVAPAGGAARELFSAPAVEFFSGEDDLAAALLRVRAGERRPAARAAAARYPWAQAAQATVAVYRRAVARRR